MDFVPSLLAALGGRFGRNWIMVFAGGGPEHDSLVAAISRAGADAQCRVLGDVPGHDLPALYGTADLFVNPSYAEGFPRVILEALAAGLPLVTTDAGGTSELLGPLQQQFVISRDDPAGFATAVTRLLSNAPLRRELAAENEATVRRFDTPVVAAMYQRALFG
jgi:glycosyltransferase involved in cell wall biosynthesis